MPILRFAPAVFMLFLAACSGARLTPSGGAIDAANGDVRGHAEAHFAVVHEFARSGDGSRPWSDLIAANGVLYGTTYNGPSGGSKCECGTVFSIDATRQEKVIYRFRGGQDGAYPMGGLIEFHGTLFGTTSAGGGPSSPCPGPGYTGGCGTLFSVNSNGQERVVYRFAGGTDGAHPIGDLVAFDDVLYGVTTNGGRGGCQNGCGTVFTTSASGHVAVLYAFKGAGAKDGVNPMAGLSVLHRKLYGTTTAGGGPCKSWNTCGTVFTMTPGGSETIIHRFAKQDGGFPQSNLVELNGLVFGTTYYGGNGCQNNGCGTIYSMDPSGANERLRWLFGIDADGQQPVGKILVSSGNIYGVTQRGGDLYCGVEYGCGTIFTFSQSTGIETPLHRFSGNADGYWPLAGLTKFNDAIYGTSNEGGNFGGGALFLIKP